MTEKILSKKSFIRCIPVIPDVSSISRHLNAPLFCYRWFLDVFYSRQDMEDGESPPPSLRRKIDSMVRDIDSIVRLLQQASFEQVQMDVIEIENRMNVMEEQLVSPSVSLNE